MKAKDTVMSNESVIDELGKYGYPCPKYWDEIDLTRKAQAEISFKAGYTQSVLDNDNWARETYGYKHGREELKRQIEIKRANAFAESGLGDSEHREGMVAQVRAYTVVLNLIRGMQDER